ncbi:alkaline phosphatase [Thalassotalea sp. 1_MG-2023]|uniref:alkaline phosphatase n=1 Tax=Thalassotalea sp. 1_MG-2023 TaxID=3062680 RepID=UPI0026E156B4|nr:alkaline phosphatase [Thalassotalea sp. 1_MG-2023]MDO6426136.1 alkaline phosphatase [Thalassotalea sp. 1_MG-2023]
MKTLKYISLSIAVALVGCDGDDGKDGTNGADGVSGKNGLNSLIQQTYVPVGHETCRNSGVRIDSGVDVNENGLLDDNEVDGSEYVCSPTVTNVVGGSVDTTTNNPWFSAGEEKLTQAVANNAAITNEAGKAKNIILFVGDGMGISTVTAARILAGQKMGKLGEEHQLSFDKFPFSGFAKTYNVDAQTPDSAGTMTAMMSGVKTDVGVIGVAEGVSRGSCDSVSGNELVTALELAEIAGKSTGVISTARITHATPAATYAKSADRNWEDISDIPADETANGCEDIASQLVNFEANLEARFTGLNVDGMEVMLGGGRRHFLPKDAAFNSVDATSAIEGDRTDGRDLTAEWQASYPTGHYVIDRNSFNALNAETTERVFGLFNESHMHYEADRGNDLAGEPSLTEMTEKAIDILDNNQQGYFLMVESGRIDHGHHAGNAYNALEDTIEFAKAVQSAVDATDPEETLIIVTADHSHVFTMAGYPKRGNPILGKVIAVGSEEPTLAADGMPYTTLGYTNGLGFKNLGMETDADAGYAHPYVNTRQNLTEIDTTSPGFHQEALVPMGSETHAGEDVGVYAKGPGAHLITGTNEQSMIYHVINHASNLVNQAEAALD